MTRVPAATVVRVLADSGIHVTTAALWKWRERGHVSRDRRGYDLREIVAYLDRRATRP